MLDTAGNTSELRNMQTSFIFSLDLIESID